MAQYHLEAILAALDNDWQRAHQIVQQYEDAIACWIHAVLHKIEGDAGNARYWYAHTAHRYEEFSDARQELAEIQKSLSNR